MTVLADTLPLPVTTVARARRVCAYLTFARHEA